MTILINNLRGLGQTPAFLQARVYPSRPRIRVTVAVGSRGPLFAHKIKDLFRLFLRIAANRREPPFCGPDGIVFQQFVSPPDRPKITPCTLQMALSFSNLRGLRIMQKIVKNRRKLKKTVVFAFICGCLLSQTIVPSQGQNHAMYPPDCYMPFSFCVVSGQLSFVPFANPWNHRKIDEKSMLLLLFRV